MDQLTISAASGLRSRMESLELLANNVSNVNTPGYKADREFYSLYASAEAQAEGDPTTLPVVERNWTDFAQGVLTTTGNPLDLALSGKGFFMADSPSGPLYTRAGSFRLSATGILETQDGYPLRSVGGKPIQAQTGISVGVQPNGDVVQGGQVLGRLNVVDFPQPDALSKQGGNYFRLVKSDIVPVAATRAEVHQGQLENSNSNPAESAVRLVNVLRQFETLQKAMGIGNEMNRRAVEEVARVNS